jgi:hypothetical protein
MIPVHSWLFKNNFWYDIKNEWLKQILKCEFQVMSLSFSIFHRISYLMTPYMDKKCKQKTRSASVSVLCGRNTSNRLRWSHVSTCKAFRNPETDLFTSKIKSQACLFQRSFSIYCLSLCVLNFQSYITLCEIF